MSKSTQRSSLEAAQGERRMCGMCDNLILIMRGFLRMSGADLSNLVNQASPRIALETLADALMRYMIHRLLSEHHDRDRRTSGWM